MPACRKAPGAALLVCALGAAACGGGPSTDGGEREPMGRLRVESTGTGAWRAAAAARATYCEAESTLTIIAVSEELSGGFALRVAPPVLGVAEFTLQRALGAVGTAMGAFRPLAHGVGAALVAVGGTVRLEVAEGLRGTFAAIAEGSDTTRLELRGRFRDLPTDSAPAACRSVPRS